jgi:hypothetical protein
VNKYRTCVALAAGSLLAGCGGAGSETTPPSSSQPASQPAQAIATPTVPHKHSTRRRRQASHKRKAKATPSPAPTPTPPKPHKPKPYAGNPVAQRIYSDVKDVCGYLRYGSHFSMTRALRTIAHDEYKLPEVAQKACLDVYAK